MDLFFVNVAYAASNSVDGFIKNVDKFIINPLIVFLFALAVLFFLFGLLQFIMNQDNEEKKTAGKKHMLWGVIGLTIMMGVFFIMQMILNTFGISGINVKQGTVQLN